MGAHTTGQVFRYYTKGYLRPRSSTIGGRNIKFMLILDSYWPIRNEQFKKNAALFLSSLPARLNTDCEFIPDFNDNEYLNPFDRIDLVVSRFWFNKQHYIVKIYAL